MQFSVKEFEVKAGEQIELEFKNEGTLPKIAMGHNIVILKEGVSAIAFGGKALQAGANATNALPDAVKGDVIAYSQLLGPGESEIVKFKAPAKPWDSSIRMHIPRSLRNDARGNGGEITLFLPLQSK